jgi:hypothetical protein
MIKKLIHYLYDLRDRQRICIALSRGGAMMQARRVNLELPSTWEFSGFSQNGEDGILDVLRKQLIRSNRYFIEIGAADGIENNSAWLVFAEKYHGIMIEGDPRLFERMKRMVADYHYGTDCRCMFVTRDTVRELKSLALHLDPDLFSLDIDGNDYYIAETILETGFRPKIFVVEYNSVFGPHRSMTIAYRDEFIYTKAHPSHLYYGVSISGWRKFFSKYGYRFITVDRNGVNGFFADTGAFDQSFLNAVRPVEFVENQLQYKKFRRSCEEQFKLIADQAFVSI